MFFSILNTNIGKCWLLMSKIVLKWLNSKHWRRWTDAWHRIHFLIIRIKMKLIYEYFGILKRVNGISFITVLLGLWMLHFVPKRKHCFEELVLENYFIFCESFLWRPVMHYRVQIFSISYVKKSLIIIWDSKKLNSIFLK